MKKGIKRLIGKKGLTLVEILVVLVVSSILIGCAMGMFMPINNLLNATKADAHLDSACNTINEFIRASVQNARYLSVMPVGSVSSKLTDYQNLVSADSTLKIKALAVLKSSDANDPNQNYRLYSYDSVSNASDFNNPSDQNNGVFLPAFYENSSYVFTFSATTDTVGDVSDPNSYTTASYIRLNSIFLKKDSATSTGKPTSQEKSLTFKILNGNVNFGGNTSGSYVNPSGYYDLNAYGDGIVILYVVKDIDGYYSSLPNPSP